eukprot:scaffold483971_cov37-Prasinocladus_malaysianus.AAC.1
MDPDIEAAHRGIVRSTVVQATSRLQKRFCLKKKLAKLSHASKDPASGINQLLMDGGLVLFTRVGC